MCVKWGKVNSASFNVSNGVRQGGILSPKLFAIYVDDLSHELTLCKSGCYIDDQCMNHVMYADDICLMAPSATDNDNDNTFTEHKYRLQIRIYI